MTDDEVMAVVGHEIGHVIHTDSKDAMKSAYLRSAVKNAAGAASSTVSKLTDSELGAMAEALFYITLYHVRTLKGVGCEFSAFI